MSVSVTAPHYSYTQAWWRACADVVLMFTLYGCFISFSDGASCLSEAFLFIILHIDFPSHWPKDFDTVLKNLMQLSCTFKSNLSVSCLLFSQAPLQPPPGSSASVVAAAAAAAAAASGTPQSLKLTYPETLDRIKEEFQFLQTQYHRWVVFAACALTFPLKYHFSCHWENSTVLKQNGKGCFSCSWDSEIRYRKGGLGYRSVSLKAYQMFIIQTNGSLELCNKCFTLCSGLTRVVHAKKKPTRNVNLHVVDWRVQCVVRWLCIESLPKLSQVQLFFFFFGHLMQDYVMFWLTFLAQFRDQ